MKFDIPQDMFEEALYYAQNAAPYTSNRHDFHCGGLNNKQQKMFEGKLGEKIFKTYLIQHNLSFTEDQSSHREADEYDFLVAGLKIDIKTRTKAFHSRTLEIVEQFHCRPKHLYVSIRLFPDLKSGVILGWCTAQDFLQINRIENHGYLDNYVLYDHELRHIDHLIDFFIHR